jgi:hypothetical protein
MVHKMGRTGAEFSVVLRFTVGSNDRPCLEAHCLNNNGLGIDIYTTAQVGNYLDTFYDFTKIYDLQKVLQKYTSAEQKMCATMSQLSFHLRSVSVAQPTAK